MEQETFFDVNNIANILKLHMSGILLYSPFYGDVVFKEVKDNRIYFNTQKGYSRSLRADGRQCEGGDVMIYPSSTIRDWDVLSWTKGTVLKCGKTMCIFGGFISNDYSQFKGRYYSTNAINERNCITKNWDRALDRSEIDKYLEEIEHRLGGKLNLKTLEVEAECPNQFKFNALDYILMKEFGSTWELLQYSRETEEYYVTVGGAWIPKKGYEVLPYNDEYKHLLGTKDDCRK